MKFQHLFFLLEIVTRELHLQCYRKSHSFVSTPFLLNRSRYCIIKGKRPTFIGKFQRLFFLMEVATWKKIRGYGLKATFQHLFFLMEVATDYEYVPHVSCYPFQHLFFLTEVATWSKAQRRNLSPQLVSTPFLPNRSRYSEWGVRQYPVIKEMFQHLFFLTEVATINNI